MDVAHPINLATDCLRFVTEFFEVISQSAPHIYHSALQLAPQSSLVWELYSQQICSPMVRVVTGIPSLWDACTASAQVTDWNCAVWSPCGNFIALSSWRKTTIHDSATLEILSILSTSHLLFQPKSITFSHDGSLLVSASDYIPFR